MTVSDIGLVAVAVTLVIQSYWDLRYKEIPIVVTLGSGIVGIILSVWGQRDWVDMLCGIIPGVVCLGIGKLTRQAVGYGDGFLLSAIGLYVSVGEVLSVVTTAIMISGVTALTCLALRKKKGTDQLPFVPFFLIAWVIFIIFKKGDVL